MEGANLQVELRDTGLADGPSLVIASTCRRISGRALRMLDFSLDANVEPNRDYTLGAEIRRGTKLSSQDLLNMESHPWRAGDSNPVLIKVKSIV